MRAIYWLDKGYIDFFRLLYSVHRNSAFFVTRAKDNIKYDVYDSWPINNDVDFMVDDLIKLTTYAPYVILKNSGWYL